jgi:hypothetical protein
LLHLYLFFPVSNFPPLLFSFKIITFWDMIPGCLVDGSKNLLRQTQVKSFKNFLHVGQTSSGAYLASYPMGTWGSSSGGKAAEAWTWPLTFNKSRVQENLDLYIQSTICLHGAVLS